MSWPIWYFLHYANALLENFNYRGTIVIEYPFWKGAYGMSHATAFFGIVQPICIAVNIVLYSLFVVPFKIITKRNMQQKVKYQHVLYAICVLCFLAVLL